MSHKLAKPRQVQLCRAAPIFAEVTTYKGFAIVNKAAANK